MIFLVDLQMISEVVNTFSEQSNLHLRRTCVRFVRAKFADNGLRVIHAALHLVEK